MIKILIGVIAAAFIVIIGFLIIDPHVNNGQTIYDTSEVESSNNFTITLEGEVSKPGTYALFEGVTMSEAITKAGGITSNADTLSFFEDIVLEKGNKYYIAPTYDSNDVCNTTPIVKVNINSDPVDVLTTINGLSATIANSIVTYRTENGIFDTIEELMEVYGIGNATYTKLRNYVTLHEWFSF